MKSLNWCNLPTLLTFTHTIATTTATATTATAIDTVPFTPQTLIPRSHPASLPICTGPWPPIAAPNLLFFPLLDANIDLRVFPTLVDFCTAPRPAACHCAFDDRAGRWEVRCDHPGVPLAHAWGFLYAIHYCERWCGCVNANLEGLPDLQGLQAVAAREGLRRG